MPTKHLTGTSGTTFQVDVTNSGPLLKNDGGTLAVRNDGDTALVKVKVADGTAADDLSTKGQLDTATTDIANSSLADMAANTIKMRNAGTTGVPGDVKVSGLTEETAPAAGDWLLMEESGGALRKVDAGDMINVFGEDYTRAESRFESFGTGSYGQVKLTHTTAALTGTYLVKWEAQVRKDNITGKIFVGGENTTDSTGLGFDSYSVIEPKDTANWYWQGASEEVDFTGSAKTFEVQWGETGSGTVYIRGASITYWRVED